MTAFVGLSRSKIYSIEQLDQCAFAGEQKCTHHLIILFALLLVVLLTEYYLHHFLLCDVLAYLYVRALHGFIYTLVVQCTTAK